jgi:CRP-like cAMP-binding protein
MCELRMRTPKANRLLAALPSADYERLLPRLRLVDLPLAAVVSEAGQASTPIYFPINCVISFLHTLESGATSEMAVVGSEGVCGIFQVMGSGNVATRAVVQSAGSAYRVPESVIQEEFENSRAVRRLCLRYAHALMTEIAQTAVCNRHHFIEQQLCRWILLMLDRLHRNSFTMTQELIASMLGVRRDSVGEAAQRLQKAGAIRYRRAHIEVLDRGRLENTACECYRIVRREFERLLPGLSAEPDLTSGNHSLELTALSRRMPH